MNRWPPPGDPVLVRPLQVRLELLVLRAQAGEHDAFAALVGAWHGAMLRQAARLLDDRELAADAVQEAWATIVRGLRRLDDPATFAAWALRIATRRAIDLGRRRRRVARAEAAAARPEMDATGPQPHDGRDAAARVCAAVRGLDRDHRLVIELHYLEGLAFAEVAAVLDVPLGTVKSRAFHARRRLRAALGQPDHPEDGSTDR